MKTFGLIILLILSSCGEFTYSPYALDLPDLGKNVDALNKIKAKSGRKVLGVNYEYKIAVISDTHDYYDGLEKQVSYINSKANFDFVIVTGDITNVGMQNEYDQAVKRLDRLNVPYLVVVGNHDLLIDGDIVFKKYFGQTNMSFVYKETKFILFNNNNWESVSNTPDSSWIEKELTQTSQKNILLFSHVAPDDPDRFSKTEISDFKDLLDRYGVSYYINGHDHNYGDSMFGNAVQVTAGSSSKKVLLEVNISNEGINHAFINL